MGAIDDAPVDYCFFGALPTIKERGPLCLSGFTSFTHLEGEKIILSNNSNFVSFGNGKKSVVFA